MGWDSAGCLRVVQAALRPRVRFGRAQVRLRSSRLLRVERFLKPHTVKQPGRVRVATIYRELVGWLLPIAVTTDVGMVPVGALIDEMRERKVLTPALSTIEGLAWETRRRAERLVSVRLTAALTDAQRTQLEALLVVQPIHTTRYPLPDCWRR